MKLTKAFRQSKYVSYIEFLNSLEEKIDEIYNNPDNYNIDDILRISRDFAGKKGSSTKKPARSEKRND